MYFTDYRDRVAATWADSLVAFALCLTIVAIIWLVDAASNRRTTLLDSSHRPVNASTSLQPPEKRSASAATLGPRRVDGDRLEAGVQESRPSPACGLEPLGRCFADWVFQ